MLNVKKAISSNEMVPNKIFLNLNLLEVMTKKLLLIVLWMNGQSIEAIISKKANKISDKYAYSY